MTIVRYHAYGLLYVLHDHSHICIVNYSNLLRQEMDFNPSEAFLGTTTAGLFSDPREQRWDW